jgi:hypothetical protein
MRRYRGLTKDGEWVKGDLEQALTESEVENVD